MNTPKKFWVMERVYGIEETWDTFVTSFDTKPEAQEYVDSWENLHTHRMFFVAEE